MSDLAEELVQKYNKLPPEYVRAIVRLYETRTNQRFLTCDAPDIPRREKKWWRILRRWISRGK